MWVCAECGSDDIWRDAYVNVNDYHDVREFDDVVCENCGTTVEIVEKDDNENYR